MTEVWRKWKELGVGEERIRDVMERVEAEMPFWDMRGKAT